MATRAQVNVDQLAARLTDSIRQVIQLVKSDPLVFADALRYRAFSPKDVHDKLVRRMSTLNLSEIWPKETMDEMPAVVTADPLTCIPFMVAIVLLRGPLIDKIEAKADGKVKSFITLMRHIGIHGKSTGRGLDIRANHLPGSFPLLSTQMLYSLPVDRVGQFFAEMEVEDWKGSGLMSTFASLPLANKYNVHYPEAVFMIVAFGTWFSNKVYQGEKNKGKVVKKPSPINELVIYMENAYDSTHLDDYMAYQCRPGIILRRNNYMAAANVGNFVEALSEIGYEYDTLPFRRFLQKVSRTEQPMEKFEGDMKPDDRKDDEDFRPGNKKPEGYDPNEMFKNSLSPEGDGSFQMIGEQRDQILDMPLMVQSVPRKMVSKRRVLPGSDGESNASPGKKPFTQSMNSYRGSHSKRLANIAPRVYEPGRTRQ